MTDAGNREISFAARVRSGWKWFRQAITLPIMRESFPSAKRDWAFHTWKIQCILIVKLAVNDNIKRLEGTEGRMVKWMCTVRKGPKKSRRGGVCEILLSWSDEDRYSGASSFMTSQFVNPCFRATSRYSTILLLHKNTGILCKEIPASSDGHFAAILYDTEYLFTAPSQQKKSFMNCGR